MKIENYNGLNYVLPEVVVLQHTGIGVAEFAGRTAYDSFHLSENESVRKLNHKIQNSKTIYTDDLVSLNEIQQSDLMDSLAWTHFHYSVLEHAVISYMIKGTSRAVLQELMRHRITSPTVRSTRYTMSDVIYAYFASKGCMYTFASMIKKLDMFVTIDDGYNDIEIYSIFRKLELHENTVGAEEFKKLLLSKDNINRLEEIDWMDKSHILNILNEGKKKRNAGDSIKMIVNEAWKVDLVFTINLRSLKNLFELRDSGAAFKQIQWLAQEMKAVTPLSYMRLIDKNYKDG